MEIHDLTRRIMLDFIRRRRSFTIEELEDYLIKNTGTTMISPYSSVREWVAFMIDWRVFSVGEGGIIRA